ncbi:dehydrogenase/reductase SDR family member 4-like [Amphibalanus amphitrite]|uniref:dehydrogenase/reductase SDR family member 4-like n=1 Tax=Amphibalanus amphitrite TaxID=1232801 RepID=UPI001C9061FA|nr:dehydrogenase/reductase SDR family member 4-like [Amphibalanus amphitrite]XP_043229626.1 dehydrogenase/reductase SDR family member 4-like [Amphibalanus amphitrite]XP_043229627.1 dehydrogenase/reductase SDR family member 4-like [Amphibalanus amphitrite]XP_043229628.1 dehydrogenase/reductase SDR family member 4-like [Amphibalanus amphitrite]
MTSSLAGKVAIVTASTAGIGLAIARRLGQQGAQVVISSRKQENVDTTVQQLSGEGLNVAGVKCHVGNPSERQALVERAVEKFGGIDILVSNAATNPVYGGLLDCPEAGWNKIFDVNVKSAYLLTKLVVPYMEARGGGSIVFIASVVGQIPSMGIAAYSVSKKALIGVSDLFAKECAPKNIRVNAVAPGFIDTSFSSVLVKNDSIRKSLEKSIYLGRIGKPEEVAGVASFLCSDDASYITGAVMNVNGGMLGSTI